MRRRSLVASLALVSIALMTRARAQVKPGTAGTSAPSAPKAASSHSDFDDSLPVLGTQLSEIPAGAGREIAAAACLTCHSADILRQQRLDEKKWIASVTKMVGWGAEVPDGKKDELIAYLVRSFGPDNASFRPVATRPVGR